LNLIETQLKRKELMEIIKRNGIIVSAEPIILSSGEKSSYYYDLKMVLADPVGATLVGELLYEMIAREFSAKSVGGLEMGAIPISTAIIMISNLRRSSSEGIRQFIVRRNVKTHGSGKKVEGYLADPIVVVDDVMTKGNSVVQAIEAVKSEGYSTAGVVLVIDREVQYNSVKDEVKCFSIFTHSDFKGYIDERLKEIN
jgi:orotate phosphoribosyltransferase